MKKPALEKIKEFGKLLWDAINGFLEDGCMRMSASLAYYTVFSIGPILLILIWALGFFYGNHLEGPNGAKAEVMEELYGLFGKDIALMLDSAIQKISLENRTSIGVIIGVVTLIITSTTIFIDIQVSINQIWQVKPKPKKGWVKLIVNRLISFSMILGLAFVLMVSLVVSSIIGALTDQILQLFGGINIELIEWINSAITFAVIAALFGFIFAFLPDAKVRFKDILGGALFTAILFMLGKYGISYYLTNNATPS